MRGRDGVADTGQERALTALLGEIARADQRLSPAPPIEQRVMEQWDRAGDAVSLPRAISWGEALGSILTGDRQRSGTYRRLIAGAGAFAAAVIVTIAVRHVPPVSSVPTPSAPSALPGQQAPAEARIGPQLESGAIAAAPESPVTIAIPPASATRTPRAGRRPPVEPRREVVSFVPLTSNPQEDLSGSLQIARVRLSRDLLADLGVMLDANRVGEPVEAEVVFGEDGMARAIRLAPASWRSQ